MATELQTYTNKVNADLAAGVITPQVANQMIQQATSMANPRTGDIPGSAREALRYGHLKTTPVKDDDSGGGGGAGTGQAQVFPCEQMNGAAPAGQRWVGAYVVNPDGSVSNTCQLVDIEGYESESDKREREAKEQRDRQTAESYLTDLLSQYGLEELIPTVSGLIKEWGTNTNIIVSRLRGTEAYKTRFRGNADRIKNGYNALSEAEYLSSEDAIKSTMRKYGLTGDYYSRDKLATLIGGDVSATEVDGRIGQAKKVIDNADPNIKNSLVGLYGVGMSDMLGYVLAPETALEVVQRRVNAGFATGVARGQGIDLGSMGDTSLAEQIGDLTFGDERTLRSQFDAIGGLARSTRRLSGIDQERVSDRDVVKGEFGIDAQAGQRVKKMQSRERARFSGQSSTTSGTLSGGGI